MVVLGDLDQHEHDALIVLFGLVGAVTIPGLRRLTLPGDQDAALSQRLWLVSLLSAALVLAVLALMVFKPGS